MVPKPARQIPQAGETARQVAEPGRHTHLQWHDEKLLPVIQPPLPRLPLPLVHERNEQYERNDVNDVTLSANEHVISAVHGVTVRQYGQHGWYGGHDWYDDAWYGRTAGMDGTNIYIILSTKSIFV